MTAHEAKTLSRTKECFFESLYDNLGKAEAMIKEYIDTTSPLLADVNENFDEIIQRTLLLGGQLTKTSEMVGVYCNMADKLLLRYTKRNISDTLFETLRNALPHHLVKLVMAIGKQNVSSNLPVASNMLTELSATISQHEKEIINGTLETANVIVEKLGAAEEAFLAISDEQLVELLLTQYNQYAEHHKAELDQFIEDDEITTIKELKDDYCHIPVVQLYITLKSTPAAMIRQMRADGCVMNDLSRLFGYMMRYRYLRKNGSKINPQVIEINNPQKVIINETGPSNGSSSQTARDNNHTTKLTAELLRPYITAGFLQEDLQPAVGMSNGEKSVLAHDIAVRFNLTNYYPYFERLWNVDLLHTYYTKYLTTKKSVAFMNRLNKLKFSYMDEMR